MTVVEKTGIEGASLEAMLWMTVDTGLPLRGDLARHIVDMLAEGRRWRDRMIELERRIENAQTALAAPEQKR